jgi:hypothetical protein
MYDKKQTSLSGFEQQQQQKWPQRNLTLCQRKGTTFFTIFFSFFFLILSISIPDRKSAHRDLPSGLIFYI